MPDLHNDAIHAFWDSYDRRTLYRIIVALENVEHWILDNEKSVEPSILELGQAIDNTSDFEVDEDVFIRVLSNIGSARAMRLLQTLDMAKPGTASQLLMFAEEKSDDDSDVNNKHAKLFIRRNLVFERLQLLSRVFAPQRISLILKALEQASEEGDE